MNAGEWVRATERQNDFKIACPEEVAWRNGWIDTAQLRELGKRFRNEYGSYLTDLCDGANRAASLSAD
ncbi:hypothetical protein E5163_04120 [Marinicauda algicola]|uniref:Glucose-1-phosphate thymidylyltransferase n=1 Tax=Marinicauda algicola TaxID=2029849 RepID=A0A4S2H3V6_9PROT|nr:hypothetical protein [Marinicauda algicola]TGY90320.1 hypothetical protein E5163_04120 [Marinicauda algicola]